eukprot:6550089-Karenia_brevis.AAC.1
MIVIVIIIIISIIIIIFIIIIPALSRSRRPTRKWYARIPCAQPALTFRVHGHQMDFANERMD